MYSIICWFSRRLPAKTGTRMKKSLILNKINHARKIGNIFHICKRSR